LWTWIVLNPIKLSPGLSYIVARPLSYRYFGMRESPSYYSFKTYQFCLNYILSNLSMKNGMHIHTCIPFVQNFCLKFLEQSKYKIYATTITRVLMNPGATVYFRSSRSCKGKGIEILERKGMIAKESGTR
jgi:hypothetical protein